MARLTKDTIRKALYNDVDAQYQVGSWFYENRIVDSAYFWVKLAAKQGHFEATLMLKKFWE